MNTPLDQMPTQWWDSLDAVERARWLDTVESVGRERTPLAAYTLRVNIQAGAPVLRTYRTENGLYAGQLIRDGQVVLGIGIYATVQEVRQVAGRHGFPDIPVLHAQYLADVPGFGLDDEQDPPHGLTR